MSDTTLSSEEKRCLQMWFRQAIVQLECEEARKNIEQFYRGDAKGRDGHYSAVAKRARPMRSNSIKELV